jgi:hypothetical protein
MFIPDPDMYFLPIPDPGAKKYRIPDSDQQHLYVSAARFVIFVTGSKESQKSCFPLVTLVLIFLHFLSNCPFNTFACRIAGDPFSINRFCKSRRTVPLNTASPTAGHSCERVRVKDGGHSTWLRLRGKTLNFMWAYFCNYPKSDTGMWQNLVPWN